MNIESVPLSSKIGILLIEDDMFCSRYIHLMINEIEGGTICIEQAHNLSEAESRLKDSGTCPSIDVILTDLGLPDSDGFETFRRVHAMAGSRPIIVLTANVNRALAQQIIAAGADDYLEKGDLSPHRIERSIYRVLELHQLRESLQREKKWSSDLKAENDRLKSFIVDPKK